MMRGKGREGRRERDKNEEGKGTGMKSVNGQERRGEWDGNEEGKWAGMKRGKGRE